MANHCYNWITITGNKDSLKELIKKCEQPEVEKETLFYSTFHKLFPLTNKFYPGAHEDDHFDVYEEYGSKWFDLGCDHDEDWSYVNIWGDSAWSPVEALCQKLSAAYGVDIRIEYEEPGCDFGGYSEYENGVQIADACWSYRAYQYQDDVDLFMERLEDDVHMDYWEDIEDFKTNDTECWEMMSDIHKNELLRIFEEYATKPSQEEIYKQTLKKQ